MKHLILSLFILLTTLSQSFAFDGNIKGLVSDKETGARIPFATVALYSGHSQTPLMGTTTDEKGRFRITGIEEGQYRVEISFIGFESITLSDIRISSDSPHSNLGQIELASRNIDLQEVEVRGSASTSTKKIDRQTYKADDFETASGGTAVDVLNKLPAVSVSPDGTVSLRGTSDFMVYLNGKPTQMEASVLLHQIAANNIQSIDIITVPTARYDAQGKGGIINIETKKSGAEGFSLAANGLLGGAPWGNVTDRYSNYHLNDDRYGGGLSLVFNKNKLNLYGAVNYNYRNVNGKRTGDARLLQNNESYYHMVAQGERPEWYENYSANTGFDYKFSDQSSLSASYYYGNRTEGRSAFYVYNVFFADINKNTLEGINADNHWIYNPNTDNRYGKFHTANIDFLHQYNSSELRLSALYEHSELSRELDNFDYDFNKASNTPQELRRHFNQTDDTPLDGFRISIDWQTTFDNGNQLGWGLQPQWLSQTGGFKYDTLNIASGEWETRSRFNNNIDMTRAIYAAYLDYSGQIGKASIIAGLRVEYTDQLLKLSNPDYLSIFDRPNHTRYKVQQLDWFPTLHINYPLNENDQLVFAASRRINRPPTKNMAPFLYRRHYEVYVVGDPELEPEYLTNLELSLDKKLGEQQFTLTGFYRGTDNAVFRVNTVFEQENVLIRSYTNSGDVQALGAELNANLRAGKSASFFIGGSIYNFHVQGDVFGFREDNSSTNWNLKGNMKLFLTPALKFTLDYNFKSATVTTQGRNDLFYAGNAALNYTPKKLDGWDFSLKVLDLFSSNVTGLNTRAYDTSGTQIFYQEVEYTRQGPIVEIGLSYALNFKKANKAESVFGKEQF